MTCGLLPGSPATTRTGLAPASSMQQVPPPAPRDSERRLDSVRTFHAPGYHGSSEGENPAKWGPMKRIAATRRQTRMRRSCTEGAAISGGLSRGGCQDSTSSAS